MAPGIAAEIREPTHKSGQRHAGLRGPNIFEVYLTVKARTCRSVEGRLVQDPRRGCLDEDGFLYIEGRLSRFSKIGGEMVPHELLEQKVLGVLGLQGPSERAIVAHGDFR